MPDRKYTYKVEIDASQAKKQAEELRRTLERDLNTAGGSKQEAQMRQATAAMQQAQRQATMAFQAESQMRVALVRAEANVAVQESKAVAAARIELEKRITAETRAQMRQRERDERLAQTATLRPTMGGRPFSVGGAMNNLDMWTGMAAGGLGAFGVAQLAQQTYDAAQQGAQLMRQQSTFHEFASRMGQDANSIVEAVRRASNATITEFDAMGLASQVLASKFAAGSTNIAGDLETVTAASRRFSQIYLDENGAALSVQEIFARMVKFAREGNKELVDQFGVTNQAIAEAMGVTVDGLAGADGAALRWQGLVKVLTSELERLGPAAMTSADRFEQSAARIEDARQRIQMAMAQPVAGVAEGAAGVVEFGMTAMGASGLDTVRQQLEERALAYSATEQGAKAITAARDALKSYDAAVKDNAAGAAGFAQNLTNILSLLVKQGTLLPDNVAELQRLAKTLDTVAEGMDAYTLAMVVTTEEGLRHIEGSFGIVRAMAAYQTMYEEGSVTFEQYSRQMVEFAARLREAADASGYLSSQLADTYSMIGPIPEGGTPRRQAERTPFLDPEQAPWAAPEGRSDRQVAAMYELQQWREKQNAEYNRIAAETATPALQDVRTGMLDQLNTAEEALGRLSDAYALLGESGTAAMTQNLDAIGEQISRLQLLDQTAMLVDEAMRNGQDGAAGFAQQLTVMAAEVSATNTVTAAQVGILQQLIGALLGATSAAMGFAGAQTQYQAAMAAKNAKYADTAGYSYDAVRRRQDNYSPENTERFYAAAMETKRAAEAVQTEWASAAKSAASDFEKAAEASARAFESALRRVPGLFDSSGVTGEQMAGAAAGIPQNFADNYLRRLADEVGGSRDWEGIDIRDAAMRAGVDPGLSPQMILEQVRGAWDDSSLFAGGRNLDLITGFGGLEAIQANIARQEAAQSGEQALLGLLNQEGEAGAVTAENAPATAAAMVAAVEEAFSEENVTSSLKAVGDSAITAIHAGYSNTAGRLNWAGPLVDAVAAQVLESLNSALNQP